MHRQRLRIAAPVVAVAALVGGVASGLAASQTHHARGTAQKAYHVSGSLKGAGASGLFSGGLTTTGTKGHALLEAHTQAAWNSLLGPDPLRSHRSRRAPGEALRAMRGLSTRHQIRCG